MYSVKRDSEEYRALKLAASALKFMYPEYSFVVSDVYSEEDTWTTIMCYTGVNHFPVLSIRESENITRCNTPENIIKKTYELNIILKKRAADEERINC